MTDEGRAEQDDTVLGFAEDGTVVEGTADHVSGDLLGIKS